MATLKNRLAVVALWAVSTGGMVCPAKATAQTRPEKPGQRAAAESRPHELTTEQRRAVDRLIAQFRRARNDPDQRAAYVEEATIYGRPAVWALLELIAREIHPQLNRYRTLFNRQTASLSEEKMGRANLAEVAQLRKAVLDLSKQPNFSKETIIARGDPAIERLKGMFTVDHLEVLGRAPRLRGEREKLQVLGRQWERCAVYLYHTLPDDQNKPKKPPSFERYLRGEEQLAAGLAVPMEPRTRAVIARNAQLASRLDSEEARSILALNLMRNLLGLPPLAIDLRLVAAARDHSQDMQRMKFFSHSSPLPGKESPWDRAKLFGTAASAENIFVGAPDGEAANSGWFHSPGHHKNMLGKYNRVGVGRAGPYFTQMFGK